MQGGPDPSISSFSRLQYVLRGCRRSLPSATHSPRLPITPTIIRLLHMHWSSSTDDYDTVCTWAACCTVFFAFLRSGKFTCRSANSGDQSVLSLQDVSIDDRENPRTVYLFLRRSKTDVFGVGVSICLGRTADILCPVSALLAYLARRPPTPGPLFLLHAGQPLSRHLLVSTIRQSLSLAGLEVSAYNGHSFRIGAATAAAEARLSDSTIQQLERWRSAAFRRYLRPPPMEAIVHTSRRLLQANI